MKVGIVSDLSHIKVSACNIFIHQRCDIVCHELCVYEFIDLGLKSELTLSNNIFRQFICINLLHQALIPNKHNHWDFTSKNLILNAVTLVLFDFSLLHDQE